jgi:hypothetical protein
VDKLLQRTNKHRLDGRLKNVIAIERVQNLTSLLKICFGDLTRGWLGMDKYVFTIIRLFSMVFISDAYKFKQKKLSPYSFSQQK